MFIIHNNVINHLRFFCFARCVYVGGVNCLMMSSPSGGVSTEEDELTLPRASINKMIKEVLPSVRVANESRELILNCCTEFIHLIASEANEICNQNKKKTINAEHVLKGDIYTLKNYICSWGQYCPTMKPTLVSLELITSGYF